MRVFTCHITPSIWWNFQQSNYGTMYNTGQASQSSVRGFMIKLEELRAYLSMVMYWLE